MKLFIILSMAVLWGPSLCNAQPKPVAKPSLSDTLSFKMIPVNSEYKQESDTLVKSSLKYDFISQYPFVQVHKPLWKKGDKFIFRFDQLPAKGTLYVFSIDDENNIKTHPAVACKPLKKGQSIVYPGKEKVFEFSHTGTEHLVLWYSEKPFPEASKLMQRVELTIGTMVKRNNGQLGNRLLLPRSSWHLTESSFGFVLDRNNFTFPKDFVLPLIIETVVHN